MACERGALQPLFFDEHSERGRLPCEWYVEWYVLGRCWQWWGEATLGDDSSKPEPLGRLPVVVLMCCSQSCPA